MFKNFSPSASVSSFFGTASSLNMMTGWDKISRMGRILEEVTKSANMLINSGSEPFEVSWVGARGRSKVEYSSDSFKISPDLLLDGKGALLSGNKYHAGMDATTGRVILGAQIRRNVTKEEYKEFKESDPLVKQTFQASQESKASQAIASEWPGFVPYLTAHKKATHVNKESLIPFIPQTKSNESLANFVSLANWNMMNPTDKFDLGEWNDLLDGFNERVGESVSSIKDALNWLSSQLDEMPPQGGEGEGDSSQSDDSGDSGDEGEGDGEGDEGDDGKDDSGDSRDILSAKGMGSGTSSGKDDKLIPKVFDKDLLDENISSKIDAACEDGREECKIDDVVLKVWTKEDIETRFGARLESTLVEENCRKTYNAVVAKYKRQISEIEKVFLFENTIPVVESYGLTSGDLDENSLHKIRMGDFERIYSVKDVMQQPSSCVGILLDQSGSMGTFDYHKSRIAEARNVVIMMLEALSKYKTIKTMVMGHTAQFSRFFPRIVEKSKNTLDMIHYKTESVDNRHYLAAAPHLAENLDGLAIEHLANNMAEVKDVSGRFMFIISDGQPSARGYNGGQANKHTKKMVNQALAKGIKVFGIGICNAFDNKTGIQLYGANNFVVIDNITDSLQLIVRKLKNFITKG